MRNSRLVTATLIAAIIVIFVGCLIVGGSESSEEAFGGTDSAAVITIENDHPDYEPWYDGVLGPIPAQVESGLFALQAALGAGALGYAVGVMRRRQPTRSDTMS